MSSYSVAVEQSVGITHGVCYELTTVVAAGLACHHIATAIKWTYNWCKSYMKDANNGNTIVLNESIYTDIVESIIKKISRMKGELNLVLHTNGGKVCSTIMLIKALNEYKYPIHIWIPKKAFSGGTFIVLALLGKKDVTVTMARYAFLSPTDPISDENVSKSMLQEFEKRDKKNEIFKCAPVINLYQKDFLELLQPLFDRLNNKETVSCITKEFISGLNHDHSFTMIRSDIVKMGIPISDVDDIPAKFTRLVD
jgi:hypothetical protein